MGVLHECLSLVHEEVAHLERMPASAGSRALDAKEMNGTLPTTEHPVVYLSAPKNHETIGTTRLVE
jgi:hypothetical protein